MTSIFPLIFVNPSQNRDSYSVYPSLFVHARAKHLDNNVDFGTCHQCLAGASKISKNKTIFYTHPIRDTGLFTCTTDASTYVVKGFSGSKRIKYVVYPRRSKYNDKPCVQSEWRLKSKHVIKTKTGIITTKNLLKFLSMVR